MTLTGELDDFICYGLGNATAESHINRGDQVVVSDGGGRILGVGRLQERTGSPSPCNYSFTVTDLPQVPIYGVAVGSYPALVFSLDELQSAGWALLLALDVHGDLSAIGP